MTEQNQYDFNFFKPVSAHARGNKKLITRLALTWALAVFGFHFLLIFVTTPTPEKTLEDFNTVWPQVTEDNIAAPQSKQTFAKSMLMVLGKNIAVKDDHKAVLKESLSWAVYTLQPDSVKPMFESDLNGKAMNVAAASIGLGLEGFDMIMRDLLPVSLQKVESPVLSAAAKEALPGIMDLYLIHNESFLTNFRFLGFPFHYWYSAQFLLILFVVLCVIYAIAIDRLNKKYEIVDET